MSVVIPAYIRNRKDAGLLDETLGTVRAQTCTDYEVIVVDDGSPLRIAPAFGTEERASVIRQANAGAAAARNTGISASTGRFLVFLDADDHLLPPAFDAGLQQLAGRPDCGFAIGPREEMTYEGLPVGWEVPPPPEPGDRNDLYIALLRFDWYIIPPSCAMFRREAVAEVGGFRDPWGADDLDFYLRMARAYRACCYRSPEVTRYRRYSASSSRDGERMLRSIRAVYARHRPFVSGSPEAEDAWRAGLARLTDIFTDCLVENVADGARAGQWRRTTRAAAVLARESPSKFARALPRLLTGRQLRAAG